MTKQRRFKQQVRARMAKTGERYAAARGAMLDDRETHADDGGARPAAPEFAVADERVRAATGKARDEWFDLLDAAGAASMDHGEIVRRLADEHGLEGWWAQQVTVDYEQARGMRAKHQRPDGFSISKSKTVPAPASAVYAAWVDEAQRSRWLGDDLEITTARADKTVRGRWAGGATRVVVGLTAKGDAKTQVAVQHEKLPDAEAAEQAKRKWAERLDRLAAHLTA